ncbi:MAG TPA: ABC transporter permease [Acidobacteriota bacterium]|nr:ABC transporter permease [Acidobacteriota bacterium]
MNSLKPILQLVICNLKTFLREPEAVFWTYGFPLLMVLGLGIAFSSSTGQPIRFDAIEGEAAKRIVSALQDDPGFQVIVNSEEVAFTRLSKNKTPVVVGPSDNGGYEYHFDASNPEARAAQAAIDDALQRAAGRKDAFPSKEVIVETPGSRYVDFLVPGLIGMNLMGGGMWGIGYVLVDMRLKKLLKRLLATPLRRFDFLLSVVGTRLVFFIPEVFFLLISAYLIFDVPIRGSLMAITAMCFLGSLAFAGLGLLSASRAQRIETISGIMNVVMLPMWLFSGIFFSSERFPDFLQPMIQALPLTQLNNGLRAIILEGHSLFSQALPISILLAWSAVTFVLALRWFRWG